MTSILKRLFSKKNRYFLIVSFLFFIFISSAIIFPKYLKWIEKNWDYLVQQEIENIVKDVQNYFNNEQDYLIEKSKEIELYLTKNQQASINSEETLLYLFQDLEKFDEKDFSIQIYDSLFQIKVWSDYPLKLNQNLYSLLEETSFLIFRENFVNRLIFIKKSWLNNDQIFIVTDKIIEKNYFINNSYIDNFNLTSFFSKKTKAKVEVFWDTLYNQFSPANSFFPIKFINGKTAFVIKIQKPEKELYLKELNKNFSYFHKVFFVLILSLIVYSMIKDLILIDLIIVRIFASTILIWFYRGILLVLNFPTEFLTGDIVNPSIYASRFGWGLVRSPFDLFLTASVLGINLVLIFVSFRFWLVEKSNIEKYFFQKRKALVIASFILLILTPIIFRGYGAAFRSFVFDSSIRYFDQQTILPKFSVFVLHYSMFITSVSFVLFCVLVMSIIIRTVKTFSKGKILFEFSFSLVSLILTITIYYLIDPNPQFNLWVAWILVPILLVIAYSFVYEKEILVIKGIISLLFVSSLLTSIMILEKNYEQERELQKTIAIELAKPREEFINLALNQTLNALSTDDEVILSLLKYKSNSSNEIPLDVFAYKLWLKSILSDEVLDSYLFIFDENGKIISSFGIGIDETELGKNLFDTRLVNTPVIFLNKSKTTDYVLGIAPFLYKKKKIGFLGVVLDLNQLIGIPSGRKSIFQNISLEKNPLKLLPDAVVYYYQNGELIRVKGENVPETFPVPDKVYELIDANNSNEIWLNHKIADQDFSTLFYFFDKTPNVKLIVVSIPHKSIMLTIFNLFKLILIHLIISLIVISFAIIFLFIRGYQFKLKFKTKLFIGLFIVTFIPIILLAYYTRRSEYDLWKENLSNNLKKDLDLVGFIFTDSNSDMNEKLDLFKTLSKELKIDFNLFKNNELIYSTQRKFYNLCFFYPSLRGSVYRQLFYENKDFVFDFEYVSNYPYFVGYKKVRDENDEYVISVPTIYQHEKIEQEISRIDTFIFGAYSLTLILIFIFGNIIFDKISKPITLLTEATKKVSEGDLSIKIKQKESGEIGDLIHAFNKMIKDLEISRRNLARAEREYAWKEMAKQVAHEIKNPLTPMKLTLQHLQVLYKENRKEFAKIFGKVSANLVEQIETLTKITNEFSHFARMPERTVVKCDLREIIQEIQNLFSAEIDVTFEFIKEEKFKVFADKEELKRVFINIVKNSIQADSTKITIKLYKDAKYYFVNIKDNGKGIAPENLEKIFEPSFSTKTEGMGLGLAIVKKIIDGLNGTIEIKSELKKGTIVMIAIPQARKSNDNSHSRAETSS